MVRTSLYFLLVVASEAFVPKPAARPNVALRMAVSSPVVVVSPPGGVGEVAAVNAAYLGSAVRWFVISDESSEAVALSPQSMQRISDAAGSLELAGATVDDLKAGGDAVSAISVWCGPSRGIICTYDGCGFSEEYKAAIRLAAKEASASVQGPQVAVLAAEDDLIESEDGDDGAISNLVGSLFGGSPKIPSSMLGCLAGSASTIRHGELFGKPESSPDFSPLVGGPRREPVVTEEYTMRNVRVDPFVFSGNVMGSSSLKSSRHAVGQAAALIGTGALPDIDDPVSISSQAGSEEWSLEQWQEEFERVNDLVASGKGSILFKQEMIVEDTERLADWLATKWAPAVMRTYDIAAIRIGARPVYALRTDAGKVEIVWQELVDFESVVVGKMFLQVNEDGVTATRGGGDSSKGFGAISRMPLPGEDVLVRQLAEASSQAVEKGLAKKVPSKKTVKVTVDKPAPVSTLQAAGSVERPSDPKTSTGPRQAGARRPTERTRRGTTKS